MVSSRLDSSFARAICAAVKDSVRFDSVPNDLATAVFAGRSELVNRAFEAVEHMPFAADDHFECSLIFISANFALCHRNVSRLARLRPP